MNTKPRSECKGPHKQVCDSIYSVAHGIRLIAKRPTDPMAKTLNDEKRGKLSPARRQTLMRTRRDYGQSKIFPSMLRRPRVWEQRQSRSVAPKCRHSNPERRKPPTLFFLTIAWFQWAGCQKPNDQEKAANKPVNNVREKQR